MQTIVESFQRHRSGITGESPEEQGYRKLKPLVEPVGPARYSRQRSGRAVACAAIEVVPRRSVFNGKSSSGKKY